MEYLQEILIGALISVIVYIWQSHIKLHDKMEVTLNKLDNKIDEIEKKQIACKNFNRREL